MEKSPFSFRIVPRNKTAEEKAHATALLLGGKNTEVCLSPEQSVVYERIREWLKETTPTTMTLGGYAGVGKTRLLGVLANELAGVRRTAFCAYTGKATGVIRRNLYEAGCTGVTTSTLHGLIRFPYVDKGNGRILGWGKRDVVDYDLFVVDEASMVDRSMYEDLVSYGKPILAVGDHGQLPPVYTDGFSLMSDPVLRLEKIHRQAESSPIIALSQQVRTTGSIPPIQNTKELQRHAAVNLQSIVQALYTNKNANPEEICVVCFTNARRVGCNELIRKTRWGTNYHPDPQVGDLVICLRNTEARIFNGMRGVITSCHDYTVHHWYMTVLFADDEIEVSGPVCKYQFGRGATLRDFDEHLKCMVASVTEYNETHGTKRAIPKHPLKSWKEIGLLFDYGYALTAHKSQGSQFDNVLVVADQIPQPYTPDMCARALYTAVTRASKYLTVFT